MTFLFLVLINAIVNRYTCLQQPTSYTSCADYFTVFNVYLADYLSCLHSDCISTVSVFDCLRMQRLHVQSLSLCLTKLSVSAIRALHSWRSTWHRWCMHVLSLSLSLSLYISTILCTNDLLLTSIVFTERMILLKYLKVRHFSKTKSNKNNFIGPSK